MNDHEHLDLNAHGRCPRAGSCGVCGRTSSLRITTLDTTLGVFCATLCARCILAHRFPQLGAAEVVRHVLDHCEHLRITPNEMAELRARET